MQGTNPRAARIAALIQRVIASNMESTLHDKRLKNVTITDVKVTNDLQLAKVYWTTLGRDGHEEGERKRDEELAKMRANANYAGDADPYRHDDAVEQAEEEALDAEEHDDKDDYTEYSGDVVEVEELEDFDDDADDVAASDDDPADAADTNPDTTIERVED